MADRHPSDQRQSPEIPILSGRNDIRISLFRIVSSGRCAADQYNTTFNYVCDEYDCDPGPVGVHGHHEEVCRCVQCLPGFLASGCGPSEAYVRLVFVCVVICVDMGAGGARDGRCWMKFVVRARVGPMPGTGVGGPARGRPGPSLGSRRLARRRAHPRTC